MYDSKQLQRAFLKAANISGWHSPYAVTLTMKQTTRINGRIVFVDHITASQNFSHFLNLLNADLFKKSERRRGAKLRCIPVVEDGYRWHYHACLDKPANVSDAVFKNLIHAHWPSTQFGYWMMEVESCNGGWIPYIAKLKSKSNFADSLDWPNFHNPL